ncbi:MAG TPA: hydrogenase 4 subunit F, partial [Aestuariivirga sp.]|nr:hydrogenase 4 subunit F [Aestuariivirga sp.]
MISPIAIIDGLPFAAAALLAFVPNYRVSAFGNVAAMGATFIAGLALLAQAGGASNYFIIDEMNIVFIVLNTLVGFTAAIFSASYIGHEIETGKLTPLFVRFYHAMFLSMMGAMNIALT